MDVEKIDRIESDLDSLIERRARQRGDEDLITEVWEMSERRDRDRRRREEKGGSMSKRRDRDRERTDRERTDRERADRGRADRDRDRERDRTRQEEENERRAATERRGEELREAWRQHHPGEGRGKGRPKRGRPS